LFVGAAESLLRLTTDFTLTEVDDAFVYAKGASTEKVSPFARQQRNA
jgi:hypothetical protein